MKKRSMKNPDAFVLRRIQPAFGLPPRGYARHLSTTLAGAGDPRHVSHNAHGNGTDDVMTSEELTILRLIAEGLPLNSVAQHMGMSPRTVRRRIRRLCDRLGLAHPIQAIVWAARRGLI